MLVSGELASVPLLDVLQVVSHAKQSGVLSVDGNDVQGSLLFEAGGLVCAESTSSRPLLNRASSQPDSGVRAALRRVAAIAAFTELLALRLGTFRFRRVDVDAPVAELSGLKTELFYDDGPMDVGELLLVVATTIEKHEKHDPVARPSEPETARSHPRFSPTLIPAVLVLAEGAEKLAGHLTNVSRGGAFFHGYELPSRGSTCGIQFSLPGAYGMVQASARVAWVRVEGATAQRGAGLSFLEMNDEAVVRLDAYLQHYQRLAGEYTTATPGSRRIEPRGPIGRRTNDGT
jgi:Domain of unknown function (DUF4388)/PilZ domain